MENESYENYHDEAVKQLIQVTKNNIKKALYKEKPTATLQLIRGGKMYYNTELKDEGVVRFEIPVDDIGDADFFPEMDAKLLNRWLVIDEV